MPAQAGVVGLLLLLLCAGAARASDPSTIQPYHADPVPSPSVVAAMKAQAAKAALAAPTLPDYQSCSFSWSYAAMKFYIAAIPDGPKSLVATVPFPVPANATWTCPTAQSTNYVFSKLVDIRGNESPDFVPVAAFTIKGGAPPLVFAVGAKVQVMNTTLLNVRPVPSMSSCKPCPTQPKNAPGVILAGPVVTTDPVNGTLTWWQIDYATGPDGWSSQAFLAVVP